MSSWATKNQNATHSRLRFALKSKACAVDEEVWEQTGVSRSSTGTWGREPCPASPAELHPVTKRSSGQLLRNKNKESCCRSNRTVENGFGATTTSKHCCVVFICPKLGQGQKSYTFAFTGYISTGNNLFSEKGKLGSSITADQLSLARAGNSTSHTLSVIARFPANPCCRMKTLHSSTHVPHPLRAMCGDPRSPQADPWPHRSSPRLRSRPSTHLQHRSKALALVWSRVLRNPSGPPFSLYRCSPLCLQPVSSPPAVWLLQTP